jgi:hypothetical protein
MAEHGAPRPVQGGSDVLALAEAVENALGGSILDEHETKNAGAAERRH